MNQLIIRKEQEQDYFEVEKITRAAFWNDDKIEKMGIGANEHYLVHKLRGNQGIEDLTFVALLGDTIVGHVIYSSGCYILSESGEKTEVLTFGPLTVHPDYQKQGIGKALMIYSIEQAKKLGYGAIFIYGHPTYYPKFGFKEAKEYNVTTKEGANFPAFMCLELKENYLQGVSGKMILSSVFDDKVLSDGILLYDKKFTE